MRFSYTESMCDPSHLPPLAIAADQAGYTSMAVPDSICYPEVSDSRYPYTPDGNREFLDGKPFIEPFTLIPALAAVTERIRFTTFVVKLAIRQPVLVAKQATSIAVLSGNRFGFGVGLSPWPEDFRVCEQPWKQRGSAHGRDDRSDPRPFDGRLLRVPRKVLRYREHQAVSRTDRTDSHPGWRARGSRPASRGTAGGRMDARRR